MKNNKINLTNILFVLYCIFIVWIILLKLSISVVDFLGLDKIRSINLIPFYYANEIGFDFHFKEVLYNVLIFIPFGIYLKMLTKDNKKIILLGFIFSLILETLQFILEVGASDITDLITNVVGAIFGVYIYDLLVNLFKNKDKINNTLKILALISTILIFSILLLLVVLN